MDVTLKVKKKYIYIYNFMDNISIYNKVERNIYKALRSSMGCALKNQLGTVHSEYVVYNISSTLYTLLCPLCLNIYNSSFEMNLPRTEFVSYKIRALMMT